MTKAEEAAHKDLEQITGDQFLKKKKQKLNSGENQNSVELKPEKNGQKLLKLKFIQKRKPPTTVDS